MDNSSPRYREEEWLSSMIRRVRPPAKIAKQCGVTRKTILRWINKYNITPYRERDWLSRQIDNYVSPSAIAKCCDVTEPTIKKWMTKNSIIISGRPPNEVLVQYLEEEEWVTPQTQKKEKIMLLNFRYGNWVGAGDIAEVVDTHRSYVYRVIRGYDPASYRRSEQVPRSLKTKVLKRDDRACVRCGGSNQDKLVVHHILPGESTLQNLATLCQDCHLLAHDGSYSGELAYESRDEFWGLFRGLNSSVSAA